jgi:hypothetical protein
MVSVLHILDMAGVPSILSFYYNKFKDKSELNYHLKNSFSRSISEFYQGRKYKKFRDLIIGSFLQSFKFDIIHIHGAEILVPLFKMTGKKVVLHYHGSDINEVKRAKSKWRILCRSMSDLIIFNGIEMEKQIVTIRNVPKKYLSNPVDTNHFNVKNQKKNGRVSIVSNNLDKKKTVEAIQKLGKTKIIDLDKIQIPYRFMPDILSKYEVYVDIKIMPWGQELVDLSTTALQALACGLKVIHYGKEIKRLPEEHRPEKVIKKLHQYYKGII